MRIKKNFAVLKLEVKTEAYRKGYGRFFLKVLDVSKILGIDYHAAYRHLRREKVFSPFVMSQSPQKKQCFWKPGIVKRYAEKYKKHFDKKRIYDYIDLQEKIFCLFCRKGKKVKNIFEMPVIRCRCGMDLKISGYYFRPGTSAGKNYARYLPRPNTA